eukprot:Opistho-2@49273
MCAHHQAVGRGRHSLGSLAVVLALSSALCLALYLWDGADTVGVTSPSAPQSHDNNLVRSVDENPLDDDPMRGANAIDGSQRGHVAARESRGLPAPPFGPCLAGFVPRASPVQSARAADGAGSGARGRGHACVACPAGSFSLAGWSECQPLLGCDDISEHVVDRVFVVNGGVKSIHRAQLLIRGGGPELKRPVMFATCHSPHAAEDFLLGIEMLKKLSPHPNIVQIVGFCERRRNAQLVTEWLPHGSANSLDGLLDGRRDAWLLRRRLALDYLRAIAHLHAGPTGTYVMCDSNTPQKTLTQFLVTPDVRLKLNDVDAVPEVRRPHLLVKCGHRRLGGRFVAPEQHWPWPGKPFSDADMPGYDEKTDIWKVPDTIELLLDHGRNGGALNETALAVVDGIRERCKRGLPSQRPDAVALLGMYRDALACGDACTPVLAAL